MKEFVEKLIGRLEEYKYSHLIERDSEMLEHCKEKEMDCEGSDCFLCVWDKATEIVNQLAEEYRQDLDKNSQGWIPVSERLPEDGGYYLVVYHDWSDGNYLPKYDNVRVKVMHYQVKDLATGYSGWNYPRTIGENADLIEADQHREVTHWKSLPSLPYQPKGE